MADATQGPGTAFSGATGPAVHVAVGVLGRFGGSGGGVAEVLIARRLASAVLGGWWEFPGGKLEPGESAVSALRREMGEELGVEVDVLGRLTAVHHAYAHGAVRLEALACVLAAGEMREPAALASSEVRWVDAAGLSAVAFPEANGAVVEAALGWMRGGLRRDVEGMGGGADRR